MPTGSPTLGRCDPAGSGQRKARSFSKCNPADDPELRDPDGGGPCVEQASIGDGISLAEEYRGFILDCGGFDGSGQNGHPGGHRRLSAARKELLLELDRAEGIQVADGPIAVAVDEVCKSYSSTDNVVVGGKALIGQSRGCGVCMYYVWDQTTLQVPPSVFQTDGELPRYFEQTRHPLPSLRRHFLHVLLFKDRPENWRQGGAFDRKVPPVQQGAFAFLQGITVAHSRWLVAHEIMHLIIAPRFVPLDPKVGPPTGWGWDDGEHHYDPSGDGRFFHKGLGYRVTWNHANHSWERLMDQSPDDADRIELMSYDPAVDPGAIRYIGALTERAMDVRGKAGVCP